MARTYIINGGFKWFKILHVVDGSHLLVVTKRPVKEWLLWEGFKRCQAHPSSLTTV
jgi:hypothetical protein